MSIDTNLVETIVSPVYSTLIRLMKELRNCHLAAIAVKPVGWSSCLFW
jgi:hypothetical protein